MKEALVFDLDGTLIDVSKRDYAIYCDIINELGGKCIEFKPYWEMRRARTDIHLILSKSDIHDTETIDLFLSERKSRMEEWSYLQYDKLIPEVDYVLNLLSNKYDIHILTIRHNIENTVKQLISLGLDKFYYHIVDHNKKNTLITIPHVKAMVGDTENDIIPAKELGLPTIGVLSGIRNMELLRLLTPSKIIPTVAELKSYN